MVINAQMRQIPLNLPFSKGEVHDCEHAEIRYVDFQLDPRRLELPPGVGANLRGENVTAKRAYDSPALMSTQCES